MNVWNIFRWSYWFGQPQEIKGGLEIVWLVVVVILIIVGLLLRFLVNYRYKKDLVSQRIGWRLSNSIFFFGITNLIWLVFRQQQIPYLAFRFWLLTIFLITGWWVYRIICYTLKRVPEIRREKFEQERKEKYFPKSVK